MRDSEKNTVDHRGSIVMPQKQKITVEEKVKIVRDYLEKRISTSEAARKGGVDFNTVKTWISIYENEGVSGFTYGKDKVYSAELKETAVIEYLRGGSSQQEIAKKYGIRGTCSLRRWLKVYNAHTGRTIGDSKRLPCLRKELRRDGDQAQGKLPTGPKLDTAV